MASLEEQGPFKHETPPGVHGYFYRADECRTTHKEYYYVDDYFARTYRTLGQRF